MVRRFIFFGTYHIVYGTYTLESYMYTTHNPEVVVRNACMRYAGNLLLGAPPTLASATVQLAASYGYHSSPTPLARRDGANDRDYWCTIAAAKYLSHTHTGAGVDLIILTDFDTFSSTI